MSGPLQMVPGDDEAVCVDGVCALPGAAAEAEPAELDDDAS